MTTKKRPIKKVAAIIAVFALIVLLFNFEATKPYARSFFYQIMSPGQKLFLNIQSEIIKLTGAISNFNNLKEDNENLVAENKILLGEIVRLKELAEENEALRKAIGLKANKNFVLSDADIIGRDFDSNIVVINAGNNDQLKTGMPVLTMENELIGKISAVYEKTSVVSVIGGADSAFDVKVANKDISGIAKGGSGDLLSMELVPRTKDIKEGDLVATLEEGGVYPGGVIVGRVISVKDNSLEPFLVISIKPAYNASLTRHVLIITDY